MSGLDTLADPSRQLAPYLRPGEQLLWSGRPDPHVIFTTADAYAIPFSLVWFGLALSFTVSLLTSAHPQSALITVPFLAAGLYITVGRFVYKRRSKLRTAYGITPDRAIVAVGASSMTDSPIRQVPSSITRSRDGSHVTMTFGSGADGRPGRRAYPNTGMDFFGSGASPVGFYDVAEPAALLAAVEQARGWSP